MFFHALALARSQGSCLNARPLNGVFKHLSRKPASVNELKQACLLIPPPPPHKPVGKYQFTMACIRAFVMIVYQVINCLISQPKHMLWVLNMYFMQTHHFRLKFYAANIIFPCLQGETLKFCKIKFGHKKYPHPLSLDVLA